MLLSDSSVLSLLLNFNSRLILSLKVLVKEFKSHRLLESPEFADFDCLVYVVLAEFWGLY